MGLRILTEEEISAKAVERWREQYANWSDTDRFSASAGGQTKAEVNALLNASDQTPDEIASILNPGWARPHCGVCSTYVSEAVIFQDEWSDDRSLVLCADCLGKGVRMLAGLNKRRTA